MNIFMLDEDLEKNARYMVDKHVVKMPLESAQMLCSALHFCGQYAPYKLGKKKLHFWKRRSVPSWINT